MQAPEVTYVVCFTGKRSISEVRIRKRSRKHAAGQCLLHNYITQACVVLSASLNVQMEALREQQQLRGSSFPETIV